MNPWSTHILTHHRVQVIQVASGSRFMKFWSCDSDMMRSFSLEARRNVESICER